MAISLKLSPLWRVVFESNRLTPLPSRTLELTGSACAEVAAGDHDTLTAAARVAIDGVSWPVRLDGSTAEPDTKRLLQWVVGVLDRIRAQGAVDHPWFDRYRRDDGHRYSIWGGRPRAQGMPPFPRDRPAPGYPTVGGGRPAGGRARGAARDGGLDAVTSPQSWYSRWGSRVLDVSPADAGRVTKQLLHQLARGGILQTSDSATGAVVYAIPPAAVTVAAIDENEVLAERNLLTCDICRAQTPGSAATVNILLGAPCLVVRCRGHLVRAKPAGEFYRQLYRSTDMRRIVAREHTSLLPDETRRRYEDGFKAAATEPQAPNVLVATPTLEMGIDIGDLSTVLLASLPRTVASYLQRVGRAGRLTGNALDLAYVTGSGEQLPQLGEPLSVINGQVRPPATYLRAEEILRRQYTAHLVDELARDGTRQQPRRAAGAMGSSEPGSFLGELIAFAEQGAHAHLPRFLGQFDGLPADVADRLRDWVIRGRRSGQQRSCRAAAPGQRDLAGDDRRAAAPAGRHRRPATRTRGAGRIAGGHRRGQTGSAVGDLGPHPDQRPARRPSRGVLDRRARAVRCAAELHPARRRGGAGRRDQLDRTRIPRTMSTSPRRSRGRRLPRSESSRPAARSMLAGSRSPSTRSISALTGPPSGPGSSARAAASVRTSSPVASKTFRPAAPAAARRIWPTPGSGWMWLN